MKEIEPLQLADLQPVEVVMSQSSKNCVGFFNYINDSLLLREMDLVEMQISTTPTIY